MNIPRVGDKIDLKSGETCVVKRRETGPKGVTIYRMDCISGQWRSNEFCLTLREIEANQA